jgi:hypothetical protein
VLSCSRTPTSNALPDDIDALRAQLNAVLADHVAVVAERDAAVSERDDAVSERNTIRAKHDQLEARYQRLESILAEIRRAHFGRKSEKIDDNQLALALEELETSLAKSEAEADKAEDQAEKAGKPARAKGDGKGRRSRFPNLDHLPHVIEVIEPESKTCPCCGGELHVIGEDVRPAARDAESRAPGEVKACHRGHEALVPGDLREGVQGRQNRRCDPLWPQPLGWPRTLPRRRPHRDRLQHRRAINPHYRFGQKE